MTLHAKFTEVRILIGLTDCTVYVFVECEDPHLSGWRYKEFVRKPTVELAEEANQAMTWARCSCPGSEAQTPALS